MRVVSGKFMKSKVEQRRDELLGKQFETNGSGKCFIIDYKGWDNVLVMFYDPICIVKCQLDNLKRGTVYNPMKPTFYNKGYVGVGEFGYKDRRAYRIWTGILTRAYNPKFKVKNPAYADTTICEAWNNFQNFAKWYYSQKSYDSADESCKPFHLDKDLLVKGNKIYSPETCCFVPQEINALISLNSSIRGDFPIGVSKCGSKFRVKINLGKLKKHIGVYATVEEAFQAYKARKESYIKSVAMKWKDSLDEKVFISLFNYEISIDD